LYLDPQSVRDRREVKGAAWAAVGNHDSSVDLIGWPIWADGKKAALGRAAWMPGQETWPGSEFLLEADVPEAAFVGVEKAGVAVRVAGTT
jgi:hypothetical protein